MHTTLYQSPEAFTALADEWNTLLHHSSTDVPFLTLEWQSLWWQHFGYGDPLLLCTFRDETGALCGIAPLFRNCQTGKRELNTLGCADVSDYLDLIVVPGCEQAVFHALLDGLSAPNVPEWDAIDLCNLPEASPTRQMLAAAAQARGWRVDTSVQEVCPIIHLPATWDNYLATLDKKERHELRRKMRRAEQSDQPVDWHITAGEDSLDADLDVFIALLVKSRPDKATFMTDTMRHFFHAVGHAAQQAGWLQLAFLTVNGDKAASYMNFDYGNRIMVYNSGLDTQSFQWLSPGIVLTGYLIQQAIENKRAVFDFLRGNEDYKYRLGGQDTRIYKLHIERQDL
jgi:CelD/BcsL family acetyltransferase involved in cellulose biosynthesis